MTDLANLIQLYDLPTGRRLFAHHGVLVEAKAAGLPSVVTHVEDSITYDEETRRLELAWAAAKTRNSADPEAVRLDVEIDRTVANLVDYVTAIAASPLASRAEATRVLAEVFPSGTASLTQLSHEQQASAIDVVLERLGGDLKGAAKKLDLAAHTERLSELNGQMKTALTKTKRSAGPTWDEVRARQATGQGLLLETVARVLGAFPSQSAADVKRRAEVLAPLLAQNEDVRLARRRRRPAVDVDPATGAPVSTTDVTKPQPAEVDG